MWLTVCLSVENFDDGVDHYIFPNSLQRDYTLYNTVGKKLYVSEINNISAGQTALSEGGGHQLPMFGLYVICLAQERL